MNLELVSRGERTQNEIIQAAYRLFLERGYHGTSMRQIAQSAEIALGGIYNHFDSKEEIFTAVILVHHPYFDVMPALKSAQGETTEEFVQDAANRLVSNLDKRLDFLKLMFIELVEFNGEHIPQIFETFYPEVLDFAARFSTQRYELRPIPPVILVRAFIGMFFSYFMTELLIGQFLEIDNSEKTLDHFIDIYLHGVLNVDRKTSGG
jgi:AcrR family transcriptional regulator